MITNDSCTYSIIILRQEKNLAIMVAGPAGLWPRVKAGPMLPREAAKGAWATQSQGAPLAGARSLDPRGPGPSRECV